MVPWTKTAGLRVVSRLVCTVVNVALRSAIWDVIAVISPTISREPLLGICVMVS